MDRRHKYSSSTRVGVIGWVPYVPYVVYVKPEGDNILLGTTPSVPAFFSIDRSFHFTVVRTLLSMDGPSEEQHELRGSACKLRLRLRRYSSLGSGPEPSEEYSVVITYRTLLQLTGCGVQESWRHTRTSHWHTRTRAVDWFWCAHVQESWRPRSNAPIVRHVEVVTCMLLVYFPPRS